MGRTRPARTVFLRATSMNDVEPWRCGRARVWWPRPRLVLQFSRRAVYQHAHETRVRPRTPPAPQRRRRGKPRLHHADIPAGRLDSGGGPRATGFPARLGRLTSWAFFFPLIWERIFPRPLAACLFKRLPGGPLFSSRSPEAAVPRGMRLGNDAALL